MSANDPADTARVEEADEDRLKMGNARTRAITNALTHCTLKSYESLEMHMVWVGDWSLSCFNDKILELPWIWKGSLPDEESKPDDVILRSTNVAAHANDKLIPQGVTVRPMKYEELLTAEQHEAIFAKGYSLL